MAKSPLNPFTDRKPPQDVLPTQDSVANETTMILEVVPNGRAQTEHRWILKQQRIIQLVM